MSVRTRFAPSPTGRLHLGNVRAAVFNWLFSRHHGGAFVLRVEDTDVDRNVEGGEEALMRDLRWLGLDWDEGPDVGGPHGPYRQSERGGRHDEAVEELLASGAAYPCFCTEAELEARAEVGADGREVRRYPGTCRVLSEEERRRKADGGAPAAVRFAVPDGLDEVEVEDEVFGSISFPTSDIEDFIIRRSDGRVTYNFAVVVDDRAMKITHVIRGVGHLSNTPKQVLLFEALGVPAPSFAHLPTVLDPEGGKLSKRSGAAAVGDLREAGYPPDAVLNYVSLLGWSHPDEEEVLSRKELVEAISLDRVGKSDTQLDPEKLRWLSQQHLAAEDLETLTAHVMPHLDAQGFPGALWNPEAVVGALRTRLRTYGDINEHLPLLYPPRGPELTLTRSRVGADPEEREVLEAVRVRLEAETSWEAEALSTLVREAGKAVGARGAALFHPLRRTLIGAEKGPDLGKILAGIGKEDALRRIDEALGGRTD